MCTQGFAALQATSPREACLLLVLVHPIDQVIARVHEVLVEGAGPLGPGIAETILPGLFTLSTVKPTGADEAQGTSDDNAKEPLDLKKEPQDFLQGRQPTTPLRGAESPASEPPTARRYVSPNAFLSAPSTLFRPSWFSPGVWSAEKKWSAISNHHDEQHLATVLRFLFLAALRRPSTT